jgi:hypothetical protein
VQTRLCLSDYGRHIRGASLVLGHNKSNQFRHAPALLFLCFIDPKLG